MPHRLLVLIALLTGSACQPNRAQPQAGQGEGPGPDFDAGAWVRATSAEWNRPAGEASGEAGWEASALQHADHLDRELGWRAACDEAEGVDALAETHAEASGPRGQMQLHNVGEGEALIQVTCDMGAYQGAYVLVHVEGAEASLVRAPRVEESGVGQPSPVFVGSLGFGRLASDRTFAAFARARGVGDCGSLASYRLEAGGLAGVVEVRARACEGDPMSAPPPTLWPLVYPAP